MTIDHSMLKVGAQNKILIQFKTESKGKNNQFPYFNLDLVKVSGTNKINFLVVAPEGVSACEGNKKELDQSISSTTTKVYSNTL